MLRLLAHRWFLVALLVGLVVFGLYPESARWGLIWVFPRAVVAAALFLIAVSLDSREVSRALARPWPALWGVVISYGVVPPLALLAGLIVPGPSDFRVGLLLAASSPCTLASAVIWTRRAGGSDATALLIVVMTTGTGWLVTPLWLAPFSGGFQLDTVWMMLDLLWVLLLPVGVGQLLRGIAPLSRFVERWKTVLGVGSQLLVLSVLLKGFAGVVLKLRDTLTLGDAGPLLAVGFLTLMVHLGGLVLGLLTARWWKFDRPVQAAVAFAGSQKSLPVALLLFEGYLQASYPLALVPVVCFHVGQLILDTLIADWLRPVNKLSSPPKRGRGVGNEGAETITP